MPTIAEMSMPITLSSVNFRPRIYFTKKCLNSSATPQIHSITAHLSKPYLHLSLQNSRIFGTHFIVRASASISDGSGEYIEEPATKVKFLKIVDLPGCSSSLSLVGTGYREKVFAIIGVKVYAAGLYVNPTLLNSLSPWKEKSVAEVEKDLSVFQSIYLSSSEKSLQIILVRDVDGKTFWDALNEAVLPRVTTPIPVDDTALSTFQSVFQGRSLKKGTSILLTWLQPSKMLVSVSTDGLPNKVDEMIESMNVTKALFDVFLGDSPVSPTLKTSVASGLASA